MIKKLSIAILFICLMQCSKGQQTQWVNVETGLELWQVTEEEKEGKEIITTKMIDIIPYNGEVILLDNAVEEKVIDGIPAKWKHVQYKKSKGWVFADCLSESAMDPTFSEAIAGTWYDKDSQTRIRINRDNTVYIEGKNETWRWGYDEKGELLTLYPHRSPSSREEFYNANNSESDTLSSIRFLDLHSGSFISFERLYEAIHEAVLKGDLQTVKEIIEKDSYALGREAANGESPIHIAVRLGHKGIINYLIEKKCDLSDSNNDDEYPTHIAADKNNFELLKLLIESSKKKKDLINGTGKDNKSLLHYAIEKKNLPMVQYLLNNEANIKKEDNDGNMPIHYAMLYGDKKILNLLLSFGADVKDTNNDNETALHLAIKANKIDLVKILLEKSAPIDAKTKKDLTPLHYACKEGNLAIAELLIKNGANVNASDNTPYTPLYEAMMGENKTLIDALIQKGADPLFKDSSGDSLIHYAAKKGHTMVIKNLLAAGVDINLKGYNERTALYQAADENNYSVVKILVENEADINTKDHYGKTALYRALYDNNYAITDLLLKNGAKSNIKDNDGDTAKDYAKKNENENASKRLLHPPKE